MDLDIAKALGLSLALGLLVGMQREWKTSGIAGIRTFPLITVLGTILMFVRAETDGWIVAAGMIALVAMLVVANVARFQAGDFDMGLTTEMAALVMYGVGAMITAKHWLPAIALSGAVAVLLHWKEPLHRFVRRIGERDITGLMQLVLIALVILPVLPNREYGPYGVLNPFKIWLMVVLISSISMAAYVMLKLLGERIGSVVGGILGGLISSTATTISAARQARTNPDGARAAALVIMIASTVTNLRILFEVGVVAPGFLPVVAARMGALTGVMIVLCLLMFLRVGRETLANPTHESPAQLRAALAFGALYAVIIFAVAAARDYFGTGGMYILAVISGLTDVDAITLSAAELVKGKQIAASIAWRMIMIAALANLTFKGALCGLIGGRTLGVAIGVAFGLCVACGVAILLMWPHDWVLQLPVVPSGKAAAE